MRFRATLSEMAASEIANMVDGKRLGEIRAHDPHPVIRAFVVGHEGESRGNLLGVGNVVKRWFRTMIRKLHERIQTGLQLFHGHVAGTNDHSGRVPIGEVVGKTLKSISGRESVVVACYIRPEFKHLPLDVASIEMNVEMKRADDGTLDIVDIDDVTGIALGNSNVDTPGFAGATLIGALQAFAHETTRIGIELPALRLGIAINQNDRSERLRLGRRG